MCLAALQQHAQEIYVIVFVFIASKCHLERKGDFFTFVCCCGKRKRVFLDFFLVEYNVFMLILWNFLCHMANWRLV